MMDGEIFDVLGIRYKVREVPVVNKDEPRKGQINFLTNEILIDGSMPNDAKGQTLMHEIIHAICDLTGNYDIGENETAVQSLSTALYYFFTHNQF